VELNARFTTVLSGHFNFAPTDSARAGAECFHDRLFGGETGGKLRRSTTAVGYFSARVDALEKTIPKSLYSSSDAADFDDVDADGYIFQMEPGRPELHAQSARL